MQWQYEDLVRPLLRGTDLAQVALSINLHITCKYIH